MPLYEYRCSHCGNITELRMSVTEVETVTTCKTCNHSANRVYSAPSIRFIGPGFHNTDYHTSKKQETKESSTPQETKAKADASKSNNTNQHT